MVWELAIYHDGYVRFKLGRGRELRCDDGSVRMLFDSGMSQCHCKAQNRRSRGTIHTLYSQINVSKEADSFHAMISANSVLEALRVDNSVIAGRSQKDS